MSNNFLVRHIMKAGGSFFVGALIALGTLCPKVLAQSTRQLIVEWGSQKTNNSQTFLWFYNDGTYTAQVQTTTGPISVETNQSITVNGRYSITGNTIRFDLVDSSILDSVTSAGGGIAVSPLKTYNEQGVYVVYSFSIINNGQTLLLNQTGGNVTATFPPLEDLWCCGK